ncbi:MAG: aminopeptidase P family protein [Candidatus Lokiarchaeota archaeon]|nr:aminopeptidase P family protein [Candidatus Lokiarchaeota archaeon]
MNQETTPLEEHLKIIQEKHAKLPQIMVDAGVDCWIIFARETATTPDSSMKFVVGGDIVLASAFIFAIQSDGSLKKCALVANFDAAAEEKKGFWDEVIGYEKGIKSHLQAKMKELNPKKIGLNFSLDDFSADGLSHGMFLLLNQLIPRYKNNFTSAQKIVNTIRSNKSKTEIALIRKACDITEEINHLITKQLKIGQNEFEIQQMFHAEVQKRGLGFSWQQIGNPAVDISPKEFGHVLPQTSNVISEGSTLHNDFGILFHGYASDLQRMWFFGKKEEVPNELHHALETIINGIQLAADNIKPGIPGYKIDKIVRDYQLSRGYKEYLHGLGHQVGIMAHDGGGMLGPIWERYGDLPKKLIEVGQIFTLEPSIRTEHHGSVSLEEMVVVTERGCEFLVSPAKDFIYIN